MLVSFSALSSLSLLFGVQNAKRKKKKKGAPGMRGRDLPMGGYDWGQIFWFRFRERCIVPQNTGAFHIGCAPPLPPLHGLNSFQQRAKPLLRNAT